MKKQNRGGAPLAALTVAAILLTSMAGYVCAFSGMFQAPMASQAWESDFRFAAQFDGRAEEARAVQQSLARTAPAWLLNALPGYTSSQARDREAWYFALDQSRDRLGFELGGSMSSFSSGGYAVFNAGSFGNIAPASGFVASSKTSASSGSALSAGPLAPLASGSWNVDALGDWSNSANWLGGVIADGAGDTGNFTFDITAGRTITIDGAVASRTLGIMNIGDPSGGPSGYTINATGGGTLTFDNLGSNAQLNQTSTSGNNTISAPVILTSSLDFTNASANTMTLSGTVTGGGGLNVSSGILILTNGGNTYSGATTISGGQLRIDADSEPGTGQLNLSGGTLVVTASGRSASTDPVTGNVVLTADSSITTTSTATTVDLNFSGTLSGTGGTLTINNTGGDAAGDTLSVRFSGGDFTMARPIVLTGTTGTSQLNDFNTTGTTHTYDGVISGSGSYNRSASTSGTGGTTVFNANNTYTGATIVNRGTLLINGDQSAATGAVSVNNTGTLGGTGTVGGAVTVNGGGTVAPGASVGTLTLISGATFAGVNSGSLATYAVDILGATSDLLTMAGILDLSNLFDQITFSGTPDGTSTYLLAHSDGGITGTFDFGAAPSGYFFVYGANDLSLAPIPEPSTWIGAALALAALGWMSRKRFAKRSRVAS